jgi:hypothetical protein
MSKDYRGGETRKLKHAKTGGSRIRLHFSAVVTTFRRLHFPLLVNFRWVMLRSRGFLHQQ